MRGWSWPPTVRNRRCAAPSGSTAEFRDYEQTAVITTVLPQRFHDYVAYERFTANGPLALLPLEDGRCTLVLTLEPDAAQAAMAWSDEEFPRRGAAPLRISLGTISQGGPPRAVSAVDDPRGAHQCRSAASSSATRRRVCTRWPAWVSI